MTTDPILDLQNTALNLKVGAAAYSFDVQGAFDPIMDYQQVQANINAYPWLMSTTNTGEALVEAMAALNRAGADRDKIIVLFTDGRPRFSTPVVCTLEEPLKDFKVIVVQIGSFDLSPVTCVADVVIQTGFDNLMGIKETLMSNVCGCRDAGGYVKMDGVVRVLIPLLFSNELLLLKQLWRSSFQALEQRAR